MNFTALFINRPVMTTLVMLAILIFGIAAFRMLPVSDLPNVDFPTIQVSANLPGASPETMAAAVATPLEKQFSTIAGIDSMSSTSALGSTQITLQFNLARNIDAAAQDVQAAIAQAQRQLPQDMPNPPTYQKVNPADQPILYIALTSPTLPLSTLDEYGQTLMAQRISTVSGVAQVQVYGSQKYAVRIQLDPMALASQRIGIDQVVSAIQGGNVNLPTGILYGPQRTFTIQSTGQLNDASEYGPLIVAYRNGSPVRLNQIAHILDSVENNKTAAWYVNADSQSRAVILAIQRQPGTNTVQVANDVKKLLPTFRHQLPASVSVHMLFDRSDSIRDSVNDVEFTLMLTLALVVMVIFLFLRNISATIIPSLALPMSIVGTFGVMYALGYSLDNLSLMAITLSVGFVVDDAIVMLENIVRHMEMGKNALKASIDGAKEISFTIVSMTISLAAVFIPIIFMGGLIGRLFREFAVSIGVAVLVSGFVALTLTPMLASRFLRKPEDIHHGKAYAFSERIYNRSLKFYERTLKWVLVNKRSSMVFSAIILVGLVLLFAFIPKGFIPNEDRSIVFGFTEAIEGISYESMFEHQQAVSSVLQNKPEIDSFMSTARSGNNGIVLIRLKPMSQRKLSADQLLQQWRPSLSSVPGMRVYLQNPPTIPIGGRLSKSQYQYTLQCPDIEELNKYAAIMEKKFGDIPGLQDVTSDLQIKNPQVTVNIQRDKASSFGVTAAQIEDALYSAYGSRQVSTILAPNNEYQVILELMPQYQLDPSALSMLYIHSTNDQLVPLNAVANFTNDVGPLTINHQGQLPAVTISFNLKPGASIGDAVNAIEKLALTTIPATINTSFQGTAQAFRSSMQGLGVLLVLAILVIYMVLGILYESFIHPITILSALPFAGFGALLTLLIFRTELSMYAFVGIIMLVGLVKKNGIMMIDFAIEAQRLEGKNPHDAILQACLIRFRPIMMTTMAALMAGLPIAMGMGAGAESRRPLGLAVVGGLVFSQTLTLYITPVFYLYMEAFRNKFASKHNQQALENIPS
ncbi:MAG: efflux RND transporter permease subunit [Planctomycetota bacterium]|nr:efflux RND transporter permease subunit [Planctomycetota bacterium]